MSDEKLPFSSLTPPRFSGNCPNGCENSVRWVHGTASLLVVAGLWFMTSLIIATVYRSNLKAMLIMPRIHLPFDNLEELYQSQYPIYTQETSVSHRATSSLWPFAFG
ncbi:hypothetical protein GWK47_004065 [Chionoecetes opilio]|uniref:Uncharacterized protein n=1 Tax=Chionoecetes opilio TaxID=41210 RepID=A0A8J4YU52_CHIOP|nr:hypothetical protein GWK47_004065 [Chionoecetes opilio]